MIFAYLLGTLVSELCMQGQTVIMTTVPGRLGQELSPKFLDSDDYTIKLATYVTEYAAYEIKLYDVLF